MIEVGLWQKLKEKIQRWWHAEDEININQLSDVNQLYSTLLRLQRDVILKDWALSWEEKLTRIREIDKLQLDIIREFHLFIDRQIEFFKIDDKKELETMP